MRKNTFRIVFWAILIVNMAAVAAFVSVGADILKPHGFYEGLRISGPTIIALVAVFIIEVLMIRQRHYDGTLLGAAYLVLIAIFVATVGSVTESWFLATEATTDAIGILGLSFVAQGMILALAIHRKKKKKR